MPDETLDPTTDPAPEPTPDPAPEPTPPARTLTPDEHAAYIAALGGLGYALAVQGMGDGAIGFRVTDGDTTYDYRYNQGDTAVTLMDRIVAQLGG